MDASPDALVRVTVWWYLAPGAQPNVGDQVPAQMRCRGGTTRSHNAEANCACLQRRLLPSGDQRHRESNSGFQGGILGPQSHACEAPRSQKPECAVQSEIRDARPADELNGSSLANTRAVTDLTTFRPQSPNILLFLRFLQT